MEAVHMARHTATGSDTLVAPKEHPRSTSARTRARRRPTPPIWPAATVVVVVLAGLAAFTLAQTRMVGDVVDAPSVTSENDPDLRDRLPQDGGVQGVRGVQAAPLPSAELPTGTSDGRVPAAHDSGIESLQRGRSEAPQHDSRIESLERDARGGAAAHDSGIESLLRQRARTDEARNG
jgi:hypothetical protein